MCALLPDFNINAKRSNIDVVTKTRKTNPGGKNFLLNRLINGVSYFDKKRMAIVAK